eukprot:TRINITY_DN10878_c0_g1_i1.p1 TRINITY_DN10878_c0_g1~~TRINITY_DN10878_c0_g1_i1.p1  ORF type:complete len:140 (+),score=25.16 TRINITY_DN10878_c0_g1_i1:61-420(+)
MCIRDRNNSIDSSNSNSNPIRSRSLSKDNSVARSNSSESKSRIGLSRQNLSDDWNFDEHLIYDSSDLTMKVKSLSVNKIKLKASKVRQQQTRLKKSAQNVFHPLLASSGDYKQFLQRTG